MNTNTDSPAFAKPNTGVLPPLPKGWVWTHLSAIAELKGGITKGQKRKAQDSLRSVPYLRVANVQRGYLDLAEVKQIEATEDEINELKLFPGDILFNEGGDRDKLGRGWIWRDEIPECIHQNHVFRARLYLPELPPKLISWYGNSFGQRYFISEGKQTTNLASINLTKLGALPIPLPPINEQHRIVAEIETQFSRLDVVVTAFKRVQANLKRYRASILQAACTGRLVLTEADLARAEGRSYESADQLLQRILQERRAKWEAQQLEDMKTEGTVAKDDRWKSKYREPAKPDISELPELPEGWMWVTWDQIGFSQNGRSFPSSEYRPSGFKLLRPGNLASNGKIVWDAENTRYLPPQWAQDYPAYIVGPRELVINLTAQSLKDEFLGRVCLTGDSEECLLNQRIARLTPIEIIPEYLLWMFKSRVFRRFVDGLNKGSLIQHMFTSQLVNFPLPLPPLDEQHRIVAEVERRLSVIDELESVIVTNLKRADRLRQAILKQAFEGKLVPQDPSDEPASMLLQRIREEHARRVAEEKTSQQSQERRMPSKRGEKPRSERTKRRLPLFEVLSQATDHLTPKQLFDQAGYEPESIEDFYEELQQEIKTQRIIQERPNNTDIYLKASDK